MASQLGAGGLVFPIPGGVLTALILCMCLAGKHAFMSAVVLLCLEDSVSSESSTISGPYTLSGSSSTELSES